MWNAVRVVAMLALGVSAFINSIIGLLLLLGAGLVHELGGDSAHVSQYAAAYGGLAAAAMVATAYISNGARLIAPVAAVVVVLGGIVAGVRTGFDWLVWFDIAGGVLALVGWGELRRSAPAR